MNNNQPTVPGEFTCPQCGYVLVKNVINMGSGTISADTKDVIDLCPNDGTVMRPVTYRNALTDARKYACCGMGFRNAVDRLVADRTIWSAVPVEQIAELLLRYDPKTYPIGDPCVKPAD